MKIFQMPFSIFKADSKNGFTVLETIVAIAVVSLAISGVTTAVQSGLVGAGNAKDEVKAFYLSQEAIEVIRNIRDGNVLTSHTGTPTDWRAGISAQADDPCTPGKICAADAWNMELVSETIGCGVAWDTCPYLRQDENIASPTYLAYAYDGSWTQTQFRREIQVENISNYEMRVTVQISWNHGSISKVFRTSALVMNWF